MLNETTSPAKTADFWPDDTANASTASAAVAALNTIKHARYAPMGRGYEVSSHGDRRFSALYAKLDDGRSIEAAYQLDVKGYRRVGDDWRLGKGKPPHPSVEGVDLWAGYKALWVQWAAENPKLLTDLEVKLAGKVLTDKFATSPISQARALAEILNARAMARSQQADQESVSGSSLRETSQSAEDRRSVQAQTRSGRFIRRQIDAAATAAPLAGYITDPKAVLQKWPGMRAALVQRDFVGLFVEYGGQIARPLSGVGGNELQAGDRVQALSSPDGLSTEITGPQFQSGPVGEAWLSCGPVANNQSIAASLKTFTSKQLHRPAVATLQRRLDGGAKLQEADFAAPEPGHDQSPADGTQLTPETTSFAFERQT